MKSLTWTAAFMAVILTLSGVVAAQEEQAPTLLQEENLLRGEEVPSVDEIAQQLRQIFQLSRNIDQLMQTAIAGDRRLSLGYTCDSETDQCKCIGALDCVDMITGDRCDGTYACQLFTCTCGWK